MKNKILAKFPNQNFSSCNAAKIYIADYTNQTENIRGIEWSDIVQSDINSFIVDNFALLDITFCAFKENTIKLKVEEKELSHCEGILFPTNNSDKTWITFIELKYPQKRDNLGSNLKEAREQLLFTLDLFREQGIIEKKTFGLSDFFCTKIF